MSITVLQIVQMFVGTAVNVTGWYFLQTGRPCSFSSDAIYLGLAIYGVYVFLFIRFFVNAYFRMPAKKDHVKKVQ